MIYRVLVRLILSVVLSISISSFSDAADVVVGGDLSYSTQIDRHWSILGAAFQPTDNSFIADRTYGMLRPGAAGHSYLAPVHLPDGASVTSVAVYGWVNDSQAPGFNVYLQRYRTNFTTYIPLFETIASVVQATGTPNAWAASATFTISNGTIDNSFDGYWLYVDGMNPAYAHALSRVVIHYNITKPLP